MTPILSVLLCLGLCLGQRMRTQADRLPRPFLRADKGPLVPLGSSVTLRCWGPPGAKEYKLQQERKSERKEIQDVEPSGGGARFPIRHVGVKDPGTYSCLYRFSSNWSEASAPLHLVATGVYDAPSLSALPSSQVTPGQQLTLQCQSKGWYDWSALYKNGKLINSSLAQANGWGAKTNFSIRAGTPVHGGSYQCYTYHSNNPYVWSAPSDPLVLRVAGPAPQDYTLGNLIRLSLAGLVLIILGVLLGEAWYSWRGP